MLVDGESAVNESKRDALNAQFLSNCEALEAKATQIIRLEQKAQYMASRLTRMMQEVKDPTNPKARLNSLAHLNQKYAQLSPKELQDQISIIERDNVELQKKCDTISRQVAYFKTIRLGPPKVKSAKTSQVFQTKSNPQRNDAKQLARSILDSGRVPQLANRLRATSNILDGNYKQAESYLQNVVSQIGEGLSLTETINLKTQLMGRELKIENLRAQLSRLSQRYKAMLEKETSLIEQYQNETNANANIQKRVDSLIKEKETKQAEAMRSAELELLDEGLLNEITILEDQRSKLINDSNEKQKRLKHEAQEALAALREEVKLIKKNNDAAQAVNKSIQKKANILEEQHEIAKKNRAESEEVYKGLQNDYQTVINLFGKMMESTSADPFESAEFVQYVGMMIDKGWEPEKCKQLYDELEATNKKIQKAEKHINKYQSTVDEVTERIEAKRKQITELQKQLCDLANNLGETTPTGQRPRPKYKAGVKEAKLTEEELADIGEDQTAVVIYFGEFKLAPSFIGKRPSQIFLVADFLDHQSMQTQQVDPKSGMFNETVIFIVKNDFILRAFIDKSSIPVQLCRSREMQITEAGQTELNLTPFLDGCLEFTSSAKIWSSTGKAVGRVTFEAAVIKPIPEDQ